MVSAPTLCDPLICLQAEGVISISDTAPSDRVLESPVRVGMRESIEETIPHSSIGYTRSKILHDAFLVDIILIRKTDKFLPADIGNRLRIQICIIIVRIRNSDKRFCLRIQINAA